MPYFNTLCRWETADLSTLSKEELIIEYVAARYQLGVYADLVHSLAGWDIFGTFNDEILLVPDEKWGLIIGRYMWKNRDVEDLGVTGGDMMNYGVNDDAAEAVFDGMCERGEAVLPNYHPDSPNYKEDEQEGLEDFPEEPVIPGDWEQLMRIPREQIEEDLLLIRGAFRDIRSRLRSIDKDHERYRRLSTPLTERMGVLDIKLYDDQDDE